MGMSASAQGERLASLRPLSGGDEDLFTATMRTEITRLFITEVAGGAASFRLHHVAAGGIPNQENALYFGKTLAAGETFTIFADAPNSGIQLNEGERLVVRAATGGTVAFNAYGVTGAIAPGADT